MHANKADRSAHVAKRAPLSGHIVLERKKFEHRRGSCWRVTVAAHAFDAYGTVFDVRSVTVKPEKIANH